MRTTKSPVNIVNVSVLTASLGIAFGLVLLQSDIDVGSRLTMLLVGIIGGAVLITLLIKPV
ncbi:MAG TPA: hypothetical protein VFQ43_04110, partial [Nitrososphaera sp.]|nr:hypothetical protein [Nitrososphaera sp.]